MEDEATSVTDSNDNSGVVELEVHRIPPQQLQLHIHTNKAGGCNNRLLQHILFEICCLLICLLRMSAMLNLIKQTPP